ncbi:amino acid ABC transporter permease [Oceanithermus sp.]|uniref:amino acid ABC transporter permease n=1 Tax=Oceanithermus sp. TaxID=2268145 RepID=UPI00257C8910|nr:amino acid ABC transporter permease [Oceanithermus sp.]
MKAVAWLKENLFNGWFNSLLTLVTGWLLFVVTKGVLVWAFEEGRWSVVPENMRLLMTGSYPPEQVWRLWTVVAIILFSGGLQYAVRAQGRPPWWMWAGVLVAFAVSFPVVFPATRFFLLVAMLSLPVGIVVGANVSRRWVDWAALLALVAVFLLLWGNTDRLGGFAFTLMLTVLASVFAFPLGLLLALGRTGKWPVFRTLSILYIELIRGVPLITVLFLSYYMVPLFLPASWEVPTLFSIVVGFSMFAAAYLAEYVRGGIQGVHKGQYEAAWALGLSGSQSARYIILPQAIRSVIPALIGQLIAIFKDTSLVYILGLFDLLFMAITVARNPKYLGTEREVLLFIAFVYFVGAALMSYASRRLERAMGLGSR